MKKVIGGIILSLVLIIGFTVAVAAGTEERTVKVNGSELKGVTVVSVVDVEGKKVGWNVNHNDSLEVEGNELIVTNKDKTKIIEGQKINILQDGELKEVYNTLAAKKETLEIENILTQSTDDFYLEPGTLAVEFSNGSYAYTNTDLEGNKSYCYDNGKEIIEFNSKSELNNYLGIEIEL